MTLTPYASLSAPAIVRQAARRPARTRQGATACAAAPSPKSFSAPASMRPGDLYQVKKVPMPMPVGCSRLVGVGWPLLTGSPCAQAIHPSAYSTTPGPTV
jgi:hypothetical protein